MLLEQVKEWELIYQKIIYIFELGKAHPYQVLELDKENIRCKTENNMLHFVFISLTKTVPECGNTQENSIPQNVEICGCGRILFFTLFFKMSLHLIEVCGHSFVHTSLKVLP